MVSKKVLTIKRKTKKATSTADKKILRTTTPLYSIFVYKTNIRIRSIGIKKYFEDNENKMISDSATAVKTMIICFAFNFQLTRLIYKKIHKARLRQAYKYRRNQY